MKKFLSLFLAMIICISPVACGAQPTGDETNGTETNTTENVEKNTKKLFDKKEIRGVYSYTKKDRVQTLSFFLVILLQKSLFPSHRWGRPNPRERPPMPCRAQLRFVGRQARDRIHSRIHKHIFSSYFLLSNFLRELQNSSSDARRWDKLRVLWCRQ